MGERAPAGLQPSQFPTTPSPTSPVGVRLWASEDTSQGTSVESSTPPVPCPHGQNEEAGSASAACCFSSLPFRSTKLQPGEETRARTTAHILHQQPRQGSSGTSGKLNFLRHHSCFFAHVLGARGGLEDWKDSECLSRAVPGWGECVRLHQAPSVECLTWPTQALPVFTCTGKSL